MILIFNVFLIGKSPPFTDQRGFPILGQVADCVIGVPSYYSDVHRQGDDVGFNSVVAGVWKVSGWSGLVSFMISP